MKARLALPGLLTLLTSGCLDGMADLVPAPTTPEAASPALPVVPVSPSDAGHLPVSPQDSGVTPVAVDAGPVDPCAGVACPAHGACVPATGACVCAPGFTATGAQCLPVDPGVPALRTQAQVCAAWTAGHVETVGAAGFSRTATTCDPGLLSRDALDDGLRRLNLHRWLAGLGPTQDTPAEDDVAQKCALVSAWNPAGSSAHFPQPSATCYTADGAAGAGSSNIAWGSASPAAAIDQWMTDWGNETTYGHRRWLLNPPLAPVGLGFYQGGNNYGSAACIRVFNSGGSGPNPGAIAWPPPGFSPLEVAQMTWTVQGALPSGALTVTVTRQSDGVALDTTVEALQGNYGNSSAVVLRRNGWTVQAGQVYAVAISGQSGAPVAYEVKPVSCP